MAMAMAMAYKNVVTKFIFLNLLFSLTASVLSLPFVVFNGFAGTCKGAEEFIQGLEKYSGKRGQCISLGDDPLTYSVFVPIMDQVATACQKIKEIDELKDGYNLIGISQGTLISRGLIELCDEAPPVKNFISVGGPQAGITRAPNCTDYICEVLRNLEAALPVYTEFQQDYVAPFNYLKRPLFEEDTVIVPRESSWFGYYPDGSIDVVLPFNETTLYKEDLIGLKTLHEAGKVTFKKAPGDHIHLTDTLYEMITPFLKDDDEDFIKQIAVA